MVVEYIVIMPIIILLSKSVTVMVVIGMVSVITLGMMVIFVQLEGNLFVDQYFDDIKYETEASYIMFQNFNQLFKFVLFIFLAQYILKVSFEE